MRGRVAAKGGEGACARKGVERREGECADDADSGLSEKCAEHPDSRLGRNGLGITGKGSGPGWSGGWCVSQARERGETKVEEE